MTTETSLTIEERIERLEALAFGLLDSILEAMQNPMIRNMVPGELTESLQEIRNSFGQ